MAGDFEKELVKSIKDISQQLLKGTNKEALDFLVKAGIVGLGPPVCEKCRVSCYYDNDVESWHCIYCGNEKPQWHAWDCGLEEEELKDNERFLRFVKGMDDASTSG